LQLSIFDSFLGALLAHLLKSVIAIGKSKINRRGEDRELEMSLCECTTGSGFQISLELSRPGPIGKCNVCFQLPRLPFAV
jgi:hypothetical protein